MRKLFYLFMDIGHSRGLLTVTIRAKITMKKYTLLCFCIKNPILGTFCKTYCMSMHSYVSTPRAKCILTDFNQ